MFSQSNRPTRSISAKRKQQLEKRQKGRRQDHLSSPDELIATCNVLGIVKRANQTTSQIFSAFTKSPLALACYLFTSMSMFYQVMGAGVRCPKIKKHVGIKLKPVVPKSKEPYVPNDMLIFSCESEDWKQTIKCLDDGRWSDYPHCPDPSNHTCPELGPVPHGTYNASGLPLKVGTVLAFRCDNELLPPGMMLPFINQQQVTTTTQSMATTLTTTTTNTATSKADVILNNASQSPTFSFEQNFPNNSETNAQRYNLTGHRLLKCLPSSKWNHPVPTCKPFQPEAPSNVAFFLTAVALILIPLLILIFVSRVVMKWRKRKQQQERWKQYFTDYKYRHSKTNITFGQRPEQPQAPSIPVTDL